jgi:hypothetical protein
MSTNVMTAVIFGYQIKANADQENALEDTKYQLFPIGADKNGKYFLYGLGVLNSDDINSVEQKDLTTIDFAAAEKNIQEELNLVNIDVASRATLLMSKYYY